MLIVISLSLSLSLSLPLFLSLPLSHAVLSDLWWPRVLEHARGLGRMERLIARWRVLEALGVQVWVGGWVDEVSVVRSRAVRSAGLRSRAETTPN